MDHGIPSSRPGATWLLACLIALLTIPALAVPADDSLLDAAVPAVQHLQHDLDVFPQNFSLARLHSGEVVIGNSEGLLLYDGERWRHQPMPNGRFVRSLTVSADGTLWIGGYDVFARAHIDKRGELAIEVLSNDLPASVAEDGFADIWSIHTNRQAIWFAGVRDLFRYQRDNGQITHFHHPGRFGALFFLDGRMHIQMRERGLARHTGSELRVIDEHPLWQFHLLKLQPMPDGRLLGQDRDGRWRVVDGTQIEAFNEIELPDSDSFFDLTRLHNGDFAMAGNDGAMHIIDFSERRHRRFPIGRDPLFAVIDSGDGGALTLTDLGIAHLRWPSDWRSLGTEHGLSGNVHGVAHWGERWFALSESGVREWSASEQRFETLDWTTHEAWAVAPLTSEQAMLADSYSLIHIDGERRRAISTDTLYPRLLQRSRKRPEVLLVGTELGLAAVDVSQPSQPALLFNQDDLLTRVDTVTEWDDGTLWLGTATRGVLRVQLRADYTQVESVREMGTAEGIDTGLTGAARTFIDDGLLHISSETGLWRWNGERFQAVTTGLATLVDSPDLLTFTQHSTSGHRWAFSHNRLYEQQPGGDWHVVELGGLRRGAMRTALVDGESIMIGSNARLILKRTGADTAQPTASHLPVRMSEVELRIGDGPWQRVALNASDLALPAENFNISFRYALPTLGPEESSQYRAQLAGFEASRRDWGRSTRITYSRLRAGEYHFDVLARDYRGRESAMPAFSFTVQPHWYDTLGARIGMVVAVVAGASMAFLVLLRRRTRRLNAERERLAQQVAERTRELSRANHRLQTMAHMDGLTGIANRRRLDSYLEEAIELCSERQRPLSVLLFDVDHFKQYNDQHGHLAGDAVLEALASEVSTCLRRQEDLLARYGGEEFTVVLPSTDVTTARDIAESIRRHVEASPVGITISIGTATALPDSGLTPEQLMQQADQALYQAKNSGRNRVCTAE